MKAGYSPATLYARCHVYFKEGSTRDDADSTNIGTRGDGWLCLDELKPELATTSERVQDSDRVLDRARNSAEAKDSKGRIS